MSLMGKLVEQKPSVKVSLEDADMDMIGKWYELATGCRIQS